MMFSRRVDIQDRAKLSALWNSKTGYEDAMIVRGHYRNACSDQLKNSVMSSHCKTQATLVLLPSRPIK